MDSQRALSDLTADHRAIRQALMRLEQAWNAQDAALLSRLFTSSPNLIDVHQQGHGAGMFLRPSDVQTDAPAYCAISVQQIVPLAERQVDEVGGGGSCGRRFRW